MISEDRLKEIQKTYPRYKKFKDQVQILVCQIKIWTLKDEKNPLAPPPENCTTLNEVESVEINETFKKLINTATVKFPRGTVVKQTITSVNQDKVSEQAGVMAEVIRSVGDMGVVAELRENVTRLATVADFSVGQRIRIKLGYITDPSDLKYINDEGKNKFLKLMFDGYIAKCSVSTPIEIKCENLAYGLKKISCRNKQYTQDMTVNKLIEAEGLLKDSGLSLYPYTKDCEINIGPVTLTSDLTSADVFSEWNKYKLFSFIKYVGDTPYVAIGRSYFAAKSKESILHGTPEDIPLIQFDYDVAKDDLTLMNTDKKWLAVEATMIDWNNKQYKVTIRLNPKYDANATSGDEAKRFDILKETKLSKKLQKLGAVRQGSNDKIDLSTYTLVQFMHRKVVHAINEEEQEQLIKEAEAYFDGYEMNGIEGSLTIFGDHAIRTGTKIELLDIRHSGKNGYYVVEEVNTTFGVNGYRQTIKLPYRLTKDDMKDSVKDNTKNVK